MQTAAQQMRLEIYSLKKNYISNSQDNFFMSFFIKVVA